MSNRARPMNMRQWVAGGALAAMVVLYTLLAAAPGKKDEKKQPEVTIVQPEVSMEELPVPDDMCLDPSWTDADMKKCLESWSEVQCQILEGAHLDAQNKPTYFFKNLYLPTNHYNGVKQKKTLKRWGDIPPEIGVCTDTVIRSLRHAGIDLQQIVYKAMKKDEAKAKEKQRYPWGKWKKKHADTNIDHRRCPILQTFFTLHSKNLTKKIDEEHIDEWQPGDIVYWDLLTGRYHIGVISDSVGPSGRPRVFHNFPYPGYVCEEDALASFKVIGHFRYPRPGKPKPKSPLPKGYGGYTGYFPK